MENLTNRILALIAISVISPLFIFAAIGVFLSDPGPVFFKAKRAGYLGRPFYLLKFRSMRLLEGGSKITGNNDSRIFRFGKFIRLTKIDELPQLFNILKGEMVIVGPRPEDIDIVENHYSALLKETLAVRPGLASPGSLYNYTHLEVNIIHGNVELYYIQHVMPLKVALDVVYVRNKSLLYDLLIITKTINIITLRILGKTTFSEPKELDIAKKLLAVNHE